MTMCILCLVLGCVQKSVNILASMAHNQKMEGLSRKIAKADENAVRWFRNWQMAAASSNPESDMAKDAQVMYQQAKQRLVEAQKDLLLAELDYLKT